MKKYIKQIKGLTDDQLILLDLIVNIYPQREINNNLLIENIPFDFGYYDFDNLPKIKQLIKLHLKLRNIQVI